MLASLGRRVRCATRPRVILLVTGDELAEPGEELAAGRIFSSNAYALAGQVDAAGGALRRRDSARRRPADARRAGAGAG